MKSRESLKRRDTGRTGSVVLLARLIGSMALLVIMGIVVFLKFYSRYNDRILYSERLSQMQDVTAQLFSGLEDVVEGQWNTVDILCNYMELAQPESTQELQRFMEKQSRLNNMDEELDNLLAVDEEGRYYTQKGRMGTLQELNYLLDEPESISFVSNTVTTNRTKMVFLKRLPESKEMENGTRILYYGFTRDMTELEPYFGCSAYEGKSSVYVVDREGLKIFSSAAAEGQDSLIQGYNVFGVLENMEYLHDSSFDETRQELAQEGIVYSNAVLNGEEYYYALYQMEGSEWIMVFLVKASAVASNTVELVNTTVRIVMIFAVLMAAACVTFLFLVMQSQQKRQLSAARENNKALEKLNRELESASKAKTDFLANMSHDIRTPMNAIVGIAGLMEHEEGLSDKMYGYISKVQLSSRHLLSLINDVLDMSRIEAKEVSLNVEVVSLAEQLSQIDTIIRGQTSAKGQSFRIRSWRIAHEYLLCDGVRLRQVIINLLSNATKYTPQGGSVMLEIEEIPCERESCAEFLIRVTDNGYGMEPEFVKHMFEPFTRAENSTTNKVQGTGLGMAITKNIVDLMGGEIKVDSTPGEGTCIEVRLHMAINQEMTALARKNRPIDSMLLLSSDTRLIENARAAVSIGGVLLQTAESIQAGLSMLKEKNADTVLVDASLAKKEGLEQLIGQFADYKKKEKGQIFLVKIIGEGENATEEALLKKGSLDGILTRPFFLSELFHAIEKRQSKNGGKTGHTSVIHGMRFLCAEDNELNAEILEAMLEMEGASCKIYENGKMLVEAFEVMKPGEYDAILMDIQMPVMNGLEATRQIRAGKNPVGRTIPILAMTANAFSEDVKSSMEAGMNAHISKPIEISVLENEMSRLLSGTGA